MEIGAEAEAEELLRDGALSVAEAETFTGLGKSELYQAMGAGELPYVQRGRRRLIPRRALAQWLAQGLRGGAAEAAAR